MPLIIFFIKNGIIFKNILKNPSLLRDFKAFSAEGNLEGKYVPSLCELILQGRKIYVVCNFQFSQTIQTEHWQVTVQ